MKSILINKKIRVYSLSVVMMSVLLTVIVCIGCLMTSCQEENTVIDNVDFSTDNWIASNGYYSYNDTFDMWGVVNTPVFSHYLEGGYVRKGTLSLASTSNQYIITLEGPPVHEVVFTDYSSATGTVNYYDPQNSESGSCSMFDTSIHSVYMATSFNHY
ncbi:hypothetical protein FACS1894177_00010 [Bacteroidia bacterium]|nr:hypothetical protein FACS1894177_00010 [Bacteroidia bacterium]